VKPVERLSTCRRLAWLLIAAVLCPAPAARGKSATHTLGKSQRTYDVLLPAGQTDGAPVVVFLHGTNQPQPDRFRAEYAPLFAKRSCVVALPRASDKLKWRYTDAQYILDAVADVHRRYRTDPKRVLLMGVSGGGQTALFLVDHAPKPWRAVITVSTNPVVIRSRHYQWFYPPAETIKTCPYLAIHHITQGAAVQYWRQVRARKQAEGASVSILPVLGPVSHYLPPPKQLGPWVDEVLAGKHPRPIPDPQKAAVARMLAPCVAALPKALGEAEPAAQTLAFHKGGEWFDVSLRTPPEFERSKKEDKADAADQPVTQLRVEHVKWPIVVRCEARKRAERMTDVLKAEETQTQTRGLLYQVYHTQTLPVGGRNWQVKIGSITYPDRKRGWVSTLFLRAAAPVARSPKQWLEVTVLDETQQPEAEQLAGILRTALETVAAKRSARP